VGTGGTLRASTCQEGTLFDTIINVYSGDCDALACVGGNNDDSLCGTQISVGASTFTWVSQPGVVYYIVVFGSRGEVGRFEISVQEA